jgi:hypothetical protein
VGDGNQIKSVKREGSRIVSVDIRIVRIVVRIIRVTDPKEEAVTKETIAVTMKETVVVVMKETVVVTMKGEIM